MKDLDKCEVQANYVLVSAFDHCFFLASLHCGRSLLDLGVSLFRIFVDNMFHEYEALKLDWKAF